jgi:hypothetical protein
MPEVKPITEEDRQEIAEIFDEYSASKFFSVGKKDERWPQPKGSALEGLSIVDIEDLYF